MLNILRMLIKFSEKNKSDHKIVLYKDGLQALYSFFTPDAFILTLPVRGCVNHVI